ncbi:MAG: Gfo/Idh/MocA family oxidoreductase [Rhodospirillales bacterium]|nr:Gfo/Idh/MocA family oxidoreductase [Rhodospirillales bacterium]
MTPRPRPVRLGLAGAGPWGQKLIAALARLPAVELRAVASRNPDIRSRLPKDCAVTEDWRALARDPEIEGVVIATPPALHAEMTLEVLAAGKAVFVEKPLALDAASAEAVLARAERAGVAAMTNHVHLFHPAYAELKRQLAAVGPIHGLRSRGGRRGPFRAEVPVLWDWGPHDVAFALDLLGLEPRRVRAEARERRRVPEGAGETLALRLLYDDGAAAELEFGNLYDSPVRELIVRCEACDLVLDENSETPLVRLPRRETEGCLPEENAAEGQAEAIPVSSEPPLERALATFADKIRAGRPDIVQLVLGVAVTKVLARAMSALAPGKPA